MRAASLTWMLILLMAVPVLPALPAMGGQGTVLTGVTAHALSGRLEVVIEANGPVGYHVMELADPVRVVIDVPGAVYGAGAGTIPVRQGPVVQVRVAQFTEAPPAARVVVDLSRHVEYSVTQRGQGVVVAGFPLAEAGGSPRAPAAGAKTQIPPRPETAGTSPNGTPAPASRPEGVTAGPAGVGEGIKVVGQAGPQQAQKLTLDLRNASLTDVLDALARICGFNLVTDSSVTGTVTIHIVGVTCDEAFRFLLEANQLGFRRIGDTLIVEAASKLTPPPPGPVTRVYRLQYLQPPLTNIEPLVGSLGSVTGGSAVPGGAGPVPKNVAAFLDLFKGTGAVLSYDDRTNSLVVTGTPVQQGAVEALLRQLDVAVPQVMVQSLVLDITSNSLRDLGIEWSVLAGATGNPFTFQEVLPTPTSNPPYPSTAPSPPPGGAVPVQPGIPPGISPVYFYSRDLLIAKLHAFVLQGYAKVLSDPRIATPDGQEALIFAGDQIPIVNTTTSGNPPVTTSTVTFQPIGVTLKIIPKINVDRSVTVQVHPVVTIATSFTAATPNNPNGLPIISIREAVTSLQVPDGGSLILGGLMKYSDVQTLKKVPFLGDLPFLGSLFRLNNVTHSESEVIIILTPVILSTGAPAGR